MSERGFFSCIIPCCICQGLKLDWSNWETFFHTALLKKNKHKLIAKQKCKPELELLIHVYQYKTLEHKCRTNIWKQSLGENQHVDPPPLPLYPLPTLTYRLDIFASIHYMSCELKVMIDLLKSQSSHSSSHYELPWISVYFFWPTTSDSIRGGTWADSLPSTTHRGLHENFSCHLFAAFKCSQRGTSLAGIVQKKFSSFSETPLEDKTTTTFIQYPCPL